jgi:hypothetical protein
VAVQRLVALLHAHKLGGPLGARVVAERRGVLVRVVLDEEEANEIGEAARAAGSETLTL